MFGAARKSTFHVLFFAWYAQIAGARFPKTNDGPFRLAANILHLFPGTNSSAAKDFGDNQ
jgi:hypothetical protein